MLVSTPIQRNLPLTVLQRTAEKSVGQINPPKTQSGGTAIRRTATLHKYFVIAAQQRPLRALSLYRCVFILAVRLSSRC